MNPEPAARQTVRAYHQRTKHRFEAYAPGPDTLDWDAQPAPFRHFEGAQPIALPSLQAAAQNPQIAAALQRPFPALADPFPAVAPGLEALGLLLQLALGITAWKSWGPDRWAVRANPSSGNLHPVEAYVLTSGLDSLPDGIYHYRPDGHLLERRADLPSHPGNTPSLQIGLSTVMWRETWKYGERAFRYCQLDTGHAVGTLAYAAALLGWSLAEQKQHATEALAHVLGLDRAADFPAHREQEIEREEAEILLAVSFGSPATTRLPVPPAWHGTASAIDRHPMYRWPVIGEVARASRLTADADLPQAVLPQAVAAHSSGKGAATAAGIILGRRSAQRFDSRHVMPRQDFIAMLEALLPADIAPWNALAGVARINLLLFVHRVEGFEPGLYLFVREPRLGALLDAAIDSRFLRAGLAGLPPHLNLQLLTTAPAAELHRAARSLHCHQDIASNACFALGMLAEYDAAIATHPTLYRDLHREAGLIGQVLYLEAEFHGLRGTGIGCFFDDPVHELLGLADQTFQTVYHFTVGLPLDDPRIESDPTSLPASTFARTS
jgi:SagB-type dehydrogenase family enzyme